MLGMEGGLSKNRQVEAGRDLSHRRLPTQGTCRKRRWRAVATGFKKCP